MPEQAHHTVKTDIRAAIDSLEAVALQATLTRDWIALQHTRLAMRHLGYSWSHAKEEAVRLQSGPRNCPACGSKSVDTDRLDPAGVECKCRQCGHAWTWQFSEVA